MKREDIGKEMSEGGRGAKRGDRGSGKGRSWRTGERAASNCAENNMW